MLSWILFAFSVYHAQESPLAVAYCPLTRLVSPAFYYIMFVGGMSFMLIARIHLLHVQKP